MAKIEKLTPEQEAMLPAFRAEYLRHGLCCDPADRPRAEAAFARAYRRIGKEPVPVIWVDSKVTASLAFAALEHSLKDKTGSLGIGLRNALRNALGSGLRNALSNALINALGNDLSNALRNALWNALWNALGNGLRSARSTSKSTLWWGQQDLYWVAFYEFCRQIGVQYNDAAADGLDIMQEIGMSCMWWYPRDGLIVACERPASIRMDDRERLHNEAGPAVLFRDGWAVHAIHGVRVPAFVVEAPETITLAQIDAERNSEVQRVMIERFGWDRYAADSGAQVIQHDERWGTLCRRGEMLFLRVVNRSPEPDGSFRNYVLPLDSELRPIPDEGSDAWGEPQELTPLNGVASTFGMRGREYAAMVGAES